MEEIFLALFVAGVVGFVLYMQIQKITGIIDLKSSKLSGENLPISVENDTSKISEKYIAFCNYISDEIDRLKSISHNSNFIKADRTDEFLERLENIQKKLKYICMINVNLKDSAKWENQIYELLSSIESLLDDSAIFSEKLKDELRSNLKDKFK